MRGVAHPQTLPNGKTLAFLTIYGRIPLEEVRFRLWESDSCQLYTATSPLAVAFQADSLLGDMDSPFSLRGKMTAGTGDQSIALNEGWSWFSINRNREVMTTNAVLSSVLPAEDKNRKLSRKTILPA